MMEAVYEAIRGVDLLVQMVDASERFGRGENFVLELVNATKKPSILLLNKVDIISKGKLLPQIDFYSSKGSYKEIIPASALTGENLDVLLAKITGFLPEGEPLYPAEYLTDEQERWMVGEIIREKVLNHTREELPYSIAVLVQEFDESQREEGFVRISATIIVDKQGQRKIVLGRGGQMIKQIGTESRGEIQAFLQVRKSYLDLQVRWIPGWRNRERLLDQLNVR
jgi:GTP-binding protein Era